MVTARLSPSAVGRDDVPRASLRSQGMSIPGDLYPFPPPGLQGWDLAMI